MDNIAQNRAKLLLGKLQWLGQIYQQMRDLITLLDEFHTQFPIEKLINACFYQSKLDLLKTGRKNIRKILENPKNTINCIELIAQFQVLTAILNYVSETLKSRENEPFLRVSEPGFTLQSLLNRLDALKALLKDAQIPLIKADSEQLTRAFSMIYAK